jgi:hypothetical protein
MTGGEIRVCVICQRSEKGEEIFEMKMDEIRHEINCKEM